MTAIEHARKGLASEELTTIAKNEHIDKQTLINKLAQGKIVIPRNTRRPTFSYVGIGEGLKTKVNANIGTSGDLDNIDLELEKIRACEKAGADAVMDLSTGTNISETRKKLLENTRLCFGTVPIYQAAAECLQEEGSLKKLTADRIFDAIQSHINDGVDFLTIHCGVTRQVVQTHDSTGRVLGIVSRGGAILAAYIRRNQCENPLFERFDEIIDMCREYDVTLSLGDGLRPGCIDDAMDPAQVEELNTLAMLARRCSDSGVQVMIEGPGHVPIHQIDAQIKLQKELCNGAPFYVLGPLVTDVAPGYDHITSAIGGAIAGAAGADFLCYVTPAEHLRLPNAEDVRIGVVASRISAHAADIAKGIPGAREWDTAISQARFNKDWQKQIELSIDPKQAETMRSEVQPGDAEVCSMCGSYCALKMDQQFGNNSKE